MTVLNYTCLFVLDRRVYHLTGCYVFCCTLQNQALKFARDNIISFIHGPPGCGKTVGLSQIGVNLSATEEGRIVATAPSNIAADNIASALIKFGLSYMKVIRIYSSSMERIMRRRGISLINNFSKNPSK